MEIIGLFVDIPNLYSLYPFWQNIAFQILCLETIRFIFKGEHQQKDRLAVGATKDDEKKWQYRCP